MGLFRTLEGLVGIGNTPNYIDPSANQPAPAANQSAAGAPLTPGSIITPTVAQFASLYAKGNCVFTLAGLQLIGTLGGFTYAALQAAYAKGDVDSTCMSILQVEPVAAGGVQTQRYAVVSPGFGGVVAANNAIATVASAGFSAFAVNPQQSFFATGTNGLGSGSIPVPAGRALRAYISQPQFAASPVVAVPPSAMAAFCNVGLPTVLSDGSSTYAPVITWEEKVNLATVATQLPAGAYSAIVTYEIYDPKNP